MEELQQLIDEKKKLRAYMKNCRNVIKKQSEQIRRQKAEFEKAAGELQTQNFTTRFHSVAFRVELEMMKLINFGRRKECAEKKKAFLRFAVQVERAKEAEYIKIRAGYALIKGACESFMRVARALKGRLVKDGFEEIYLSWLLSQPDSLRAKVELRKIENRRLKGVLADSRDPVEEVKEMNQRLKEKLKSTETSVGCFIRDMGNLLSFNGGLRNLSPRLAQLDKSKHKKKLKKLSPERKDATKRPKLTRINFPY